MVKSIDKCGITKKAEGFETFLEFETTRPYGVAQVSLIYVHFPLCLCKREDFH